MASSLTSAFRQFAAAQENPDAEGARSTALPNVHFFRAARHLARTPLVYEPGLVIVGQGHKTGYLAGREFRYDAENYLILGVPLPFECETFGSPHEPLLGLKIDVDVARVQALLDAMAEPVPPGGDRACDHLGLSPVALDPSMVDATKRLLQCLQDPTDTRVLGRAIVDELIYRALVGPHGRVLKELTQQTGFARVARALDFVHRNYARAISVEELAEEAAMSASRFFREFKEVTGDTPLQYIKKIRLDKAQGLLRNQGAAVSSVAYEVGYTSPAQFSREFRRHFATSPSAMREASLAPTAQAGSAA